MAFVKIPESTIQVKLVELTDNCIDKIADAVVRKLADRKTEPSNSEKPNNCEPQTDDDKKHCVFCKWVYEPNVCGRCRNMNLFADAIEDEPNCSEKPNSCKDEARIITDGTYLYAHDKMLGEWRPIQDISGHKQTERSSE